jgi:hypothetical protein
LSRNRGHVLAQRLGGALRILEQLVDAIEVSDGRRAEALARDYNTHVRRQIIEILSTSLAGAIKMPVPARRPA